MPVTGPTDALRPPDGPGRRRRSASASASERSTASEFRAAGLLPRSRFLVRLGLREVFPDPGGALGLVLAVAVLATHAWVPFASSRGYLFSPSLAGEAAGHLWLLAGPPLALYLCLRHLYARGTSPLPLFGVPLAAFLTIVTLVGVALSIGVG